MTGLPTLLVKLDDGTGTFPYDISQYVRLVDGYTISRGRADEYGDVQPSTLTITLENTDGRFTYGSVTYLCFIDQMIQVSLNAGASLVKRFTGYVQSWPVAFPDGSDQFAVAQITAMDRLSKLARQKLKSITEQEILADSPFAYYTLGEAAGATSAGDTSSNGGPALVATYVTPGTPATLPAFGAGGPNAWDGMTAAQFSALGQVLRREPIVWSGSASTFEVVFTATSAPGFTQTLLALGASFLNVLLVSSGKAVFASILASASAITDGQPHHLAATVSGGTLTAYVDGVSLGTTACPEVPSFIQLGDASLAVVGSVSHLAIYSTALSAARILAHANAIRNGFNTERSDQRIARLAGYAGIIAGAMSLEVGVQAAVPAQATTGSNPGDAIAAVSGSEGGVTFIRGDGNLVMQNRQHRALELTPVLSLTAIDVGPDTAPTVDMQKVINYAEVTAAGTGSKQTAANAASIAAHGQYPTSLSPLMKTDAEAIDRANWVVTVESAPQPRLPGVKVDLLAQVAAVQQTALTVELSDRLTVTGLPSQTPGGTTATLVVEGWTETWKLDTWEMAFNTSNWETYRAWLLDNATYSVLGTTTRLGS